MSEHPQHPVTPRHVAHDHGAHHAHPGAGVHLSAEEERKATEEESLNARVIHEVIRREGELELERPASALAWSGLAAGLSMGLSMIGDGVLRAHLPEAAWRPLVTKLGFTLGFLVVTLGSQQLYTENTLRPIVPLLRHRSAERLRQLLKVWGVVLAANLVGALLVAMTVAWTDMFSLEVRTAFDAIGHEALEGSWGTRFVRAVAAGWIIALMVWMLPAASTAKVLVIILMTWLVGAGHLAHVITGSVEVQYLALRGGVGYGTYLLHFLLPVLLGNTVGGVVLVAALNHAQADRGSQHEK